jgi:excinuclease ABC subunit C
VAALTTAEEYGRAVEEVVLLLEGRHQELRPRLQGQMWRASESHEFERAARYRDLLHALDELARGQHVEIAGSGSVDVVGVEGDGRDATIAVLIYRDGKLVDKREFHLEGLEAPADGTFLGAFLGQFCEASRDSGASSAVRARPTSLWVSWRSNVAQRQAASARRGGERACWRWHGKRP